MESDQQLRSLKRGLQALVLLNDSGLLTVSDLARKLKVPRTTAHRILDTLVAEQYAERVPNGRGYQLTPMVRMLSHGFDDESWIAKIASPLIERLASEIKWPLSLTTPRGAFMLVRLCTDHSSPLALVKHRPGFLAPMLGTSAGHTYLAHSNAEQRELMLDSILGPGEGDRGQLAVLLDKIRRDGFMLMEHKQYSEGGISVPILVNGDPIACLAMRYIKSAMTPAEVVANYLERLRATADLIARSSVGGTDAEPAADAAEHVKANGAWAEPLPYARTRFPADGERARQRFS